MKHQVLLVTALVLLVNGAAWAKGGCQPATTTAPAMTPATAATTAGTSLKGALGIAQPAWLSLDNCCIICEQYEQECVAGCPGPRSPGHFICIEQCNQDYLYCTAGCSIAC